MKLKVKIFIYVVSVLIVGVTFLQHAMANINGTMTVTIQDYCTFTRTTGNGAYSMSMMANELNANVGTSTFTASCNNGGGFSVGVSPTNISGVGTDIAYSATTPTAGSGTWTAYNSTADSNIASSNGILMSSLTVVASQAATVIYKVGTSSNQAKGSYVGTITYALTKNS